jgi:ankyrin repeat protein
MEASIDLDIAKQVDGVLEEPAAVGAFIDGDVESNVGDWTLDDASKRCMPWLKAALARAHTDAALKERVKMLLGEPYFSKNLGAEGLWEDLHAFACQLALELGTGMQEYFDEHRLGDVVGSGLPNVTNALLRQKDRYEVVLLKLNPDVSSSCLRQDSVSILPFPRDESKSQFDNEKKHMHFLRMVAMGVDARFQEEVRGVCRRCNGTFRAAPIKAFGRMKIKCLSRGDYFYDAYPRSARVLDVNRNTSSFEGPHGLFQFVQMMQAHGQFGAHPIRIKNMFALDGERAKKHYHFRAVMVNWLYTPGVTYKELAAEAGELWDRYYNFTQLPEHGEKDASESWSEWRSQIAVALDHLTSPFLANQQVQFVVETQVLLRPYLEARHNMHMIYQICRCADSEALYKEFQETSLRAAEEDLISFEEHQLSCLEYYEMFLDENDDVNQIIPDTGGNTLLMDATLREAADAVNMLLGRPGILVNQPDDEGYTPLFCASGGGFNGELELLLAHPDIDVNMIVKGETALSMAATNGQEVAAKLLSSVPAIDVNRRRKADGATAFTMACDCGHYEIVRCLLDHPDIDINVVNVVGGTRAVKNEGECALFVAAEMGHEHIVELLLRRPEIVIDHPRRRDGLTPLGIAVQQGHLKVVEMLQVYIDAKAEGDAKFDLPAPPSSKRDGEKGGAPPGKRQQK